MKRLFKEARQPHESHLPYPQPWEFVYEGFFKGIRNGFFVDIGASNGIDASNTSLFEFYLGWDGICIEPNSEQYSQLKRNRSVKTYNCCVSDKNGVETFCEITGNKSSLSGIKRFYDKRHEDRIRRENGKCLYRDVEAKTLSQIFEENSVVNVDYLSVDVECAEARVLRGIDFSKYKITIISAEDNYNSGDSKKFLLDNGYRFIQKVCGDNIFARI